MNKEEVIKYFNLNNDEVDRIEYFYRTLSNKNNHMNLVGKSTIPDFWDRHICDSLQLTKYIENKNLNILDLGTGAGLPGIILSIVGYENILMVDSTSKKINFVEGIIKALQCYNVFGKTYNLASGKPIKVKSVINKKSKPEVIYHKTDIKPKSSQSKKKATKTSAKKSSSKSNKKVI